MRFTQNCLLRFTPPDWVLGTLTQQSPSPSDVHWKEGVFVVGPESLPS